MAEDGDDEDDEGDDEGDADEGDEKYAAAEEEEGDTGEVCLSPPMLSVFISALRRASCVVACAAFSLRRAASVCEKQRKSREQRDRVQSSKTPHKPLKAPSKPPHSYLHQLFARASVRGGGRRQLVLCVHEFGLQNGERRGRGARGGGGG